MELSKDEKHTMQLALMGQMMNCREIIEGEFVKESAKEEARSHP